MFNLPRFLISPIACFLCLPIMCHFRVDPRYSTLDFPHDNAYINTRQPIITGSLYDQYLKAVVGETIHIFINGSRTGSTRSNEYGIYRCILEQPLDDGVYTISILCVESEMTIGPVSMTIDTSLPTTTIVYPQENDRIHATLVSVSGMTEPYAMVTTYVDNDIYGQICYADQGGVWSIDYPAKEGFHTIVAHASNRAGTQGPLSKVQHFFVDVVELTK